MLGFLLLLRKTVLQSMYKEALLSIREMEQNLEDQTPPPILFTGFYRSGSTFLGEVLKPATRGITEPLGYFTDTPHEQRMSAEDFDSQLLYPSFHGYDVLFHHMMQTWLQNESNYSKPALIKETEIGLHLDWLSKVVPVNTKLLFVRRDPRGIVASFKKDNLYDKWEFDNRFDKLARTVMTDPTMNKYLPIIKEAADADWLDKLLAYYSITMNEIDQGIKEWPGKIVEYSYETLMQNPQSELERIVISLELKNIERISDKFNQLTSFSSPTANSDPHAIFKAKVDIYDWISTLTAEEINRIEIRLFSWGRSADLNELSLDVLQRIGKQEQKAIFERQPLIQKEYRVPQFTSRDEVVNSILEQAILLKNDRDKEISMSGTHITNEQMAYFLNWLTSQEIPLTNKRPNPFINDVQLSRIRHIDGIWQVENGFENHPATYCTHLAFTTFALWCGGRLPTSLEWEYAASGDTNTIYPWGNELPDKEIVNYGGNRGKTNAVKALVPQTHKGFYDMGGNVADWTSDIDYETLEAMTKGGSYKDLLEDLEVTAEGRRLFFLGAMSVGARVTFENNKQIFSEEEYLEKIIGIFNLLNNMDAIKNREAKEIVRQVYTMLSE